MFRLSVQCFFFCRNTVEIGPSYAWNDAKACDVGKKNNWKIIRNMKCLCVLRFLWRFFFYLSLLYLSKLIGFVSRKWTHTYNCKFKYKQNVNFFSKKSNERHTTRFIYKNVFVELESNEFGSYTHTHTHKYRQLNMVEVFPRIYAIKKDPIDEIIKENEK